MPRARIGRALSDRALSVVGSIEQRFSAFLQRIEREHDPTLRELIRAWNNGTLEIQLNDVEVATRGTIDLHAGNQIVLTVEDDATEEEVDITIAVDPAVTSSSASGALSLDLSGTLRRFRYDLSGNVTSIAIGTAPAQAGNWVFDFVQDATGSRTLPVAAANWPSPSTFTDSTPPVIDGTALGHNWVTLYYDGTLYHWLVGCNPSMEV